MDRPHFCADPHEARIMPKTTLDPALQAALDRAVWSTASVNDLPDSAFAYIEDGGKKDDEGKTTPRSLRHLPYKNADGKVDPAHVRNALARLSQTQIPDAAKAAAKKKLVAAAKSVGIEVSDDDDKEDRAMGAEQTLSRASANHEPMTGTHSHAHPAFQSQGDDDTHEHEHSHDNDNNHDHKHDEERAAAFGIQASDRHVMSLPLVRIDAAKREVWGQATAEVPDSYGTIFGYCPEAWRSWRGNIREQHDPKKAVGKRVELECNDQERAIYVGSRVSRGAQDTWLKVEDNVLTGYSASIIPDPEYGSDPARWPKKEYNGKQYHYLPRYTVAELSLVDNPACPGCNIQIVRADGFATDVLDTSEEEAPTPVESHPPVSLERAGARVSSDTRGAMHDGIGHTLKAAVSQMQNCGCDACTAAMKLIDPDSDGDIDLGGYDDPDQDWQSLYDGTMTGGTETEMGRALSGLVERVLTEHLSAVYTRLQGIAGTLARNNASPIIPEELLTGAITRAVEASATAMKSSLDEVRADLSAVKDQVEKIADTPVPGAPIMHAGALPRPVDKRLATDPVSTDPYAPPKRTGSAVADAMQVLAKQGYLNNFDAQMEALSAGLALQKRAESGR